jgi:dihydrofolate reductase
MRKLRVFESITVNGYFSGPGGDLSWAHASSHDREYQKFVQGNASSPGLMLFGRVTYEMMKSYWPTPVALKNDPVVAKGMNEATKVVFSRTLQEADWANSSLEKVDVADKVKKLKKESKKDLVVLGSGTLVAQLADAGLVDEYQFVVKPVALGNGRTVFDGVKKPVALELISSRVFKNGSVVLNYRPAE